MLLVTTLTHILCHTQLLCMAACARSAGRFLTISDVLTSSSAVASTALVVLNVPLHVPTVAQLWRACRTRVCADGASFRLADADLKAAPLRFIPDVIAGDMDSASSSVCVHVWCARFCGRWLCVLSWFLHHTVWAAATRHIQVARLHHCGGQR